MQNDSHGGSTNNKIMFLEGSRYKDVRAKVEGSGINKVFLEDLYIRMPKAYIMFSIHNVARLFCKETHAIWPCVVDVRTI